MRFLCWVSRRKPLCFFFYRTKSKTENVVFGLSKFLTLSCACFIFLLCVNLKKYGFHTRSCSSVLLQSSWMFRTVKATVRTRSQKLWRAGFTHIPKEFFWKQCYLWRFGTTYEPVERTLLHWCSGNNQNFEMIMLEIRILWEKLILTRCNAKFVIMYLRCFYFSLREKSNTGAWKRRLHSIKG